MVAAATAVRVRNAAAETPYISPSGAHTPRYTPCAGEQDQPRIICIAYSATLRVNAILSCTHIITDGRQSSADEPCARARPDNDFNE